MSKVQKSDAGITVDRKSQTEINLDKIDAAVEAIRYAYHDGEDPTVETLRRLTAARQDIDDAIGGMLDCCPDGFEL